MRKFTKKQNLYAHLIEARRQRERYGRIMERHEDAGNTERADIIMATTEKRFSKEKWLEAAKAQMARGHLSQREIDDACEIWVNDLDGKTQSEIEASGNQPLNEAWFV